VLRRRSLPVLLVALAVLGTGCGSTPEHTQGRGRQPTASPQPLDERDQLVDVLPKDAIPSIEEPRFVQPDEAGWMAGREPVVSVQIAGDSRAYPAQILTRHEIVNDVVGGRPVTVTYCPLCNSAVAFSRAVKGQTLEFGVSGKLYHSALVMYDRQTGSLWTHFDGLAVRGPLTGTQLEVLPSQLISFDEWRETYPRGRVLSRETGFPIDYGANPYEHYDSREAPYGQFIEEQADPRLPAMARVVGVSTGDREVAFAYGDLSGPGGVGVINDGPVVLFWKAGTASALDDPQIARGQDVGATGVFSPEANGRRATFEARGGAIVDRETGSTWSLTGRAVEGPLEGQALDPVAHLDTFWFAWLAYHPDTEVYDADG
jgi:hypothetical protein